MILLKGGPDALRLVVAANRQRPLVEDDEEALHVALHERVYAYCQKGGRVRGDAPTWDELLEVARSLHLDVLDLDPGSPTSIHLEDALRRDSAETPALDAAAAALKERIIDQLKRQNVVLGGVMTGDDVLAVVLMRYGELEGKGAAIKAMEPSYDEDPRHATFKNCYYSPDLILFTHAAVVTPRE